MRQLGAKVACWCQLDDTGEPCDRDVHALYRAVVTAVDTRGISLRYRPTSDEPAEAWMLVDNVHSRVPIVIPPATGDEPRVDVLNEDIPAYVRCAHEDPPASAAAAGACGKQPVGSGALENPERSSTTTPVPVPEQTGVSDVGLNTSETSQPSTKRKRPARTKTSWVAELVGRITRITGTSHDVTVAEVTQKEELALAVQQYVDRGLVATSKKEDCKALLGNPGVFTLKLVDADLVTSAHATIGVPTSTVPSGIRSLEILCATRTTTCHQLPPPPLPPPL